MELSRYHWVGLLSGVPLFSGAWLAAYYNNSWLGLLGLVIAAGGLFVAIHVERRSDRMTQLRRGLIAGVLAAAVARALGFVASLMIGADQSAHFASYGDLWSVVLAGGWLASLSLLVFGGVIGMVVSVFEPEAARTERSSAPEPRPRVEAETSAPTVTKIKATSTKKAKKGRRS